MIPICPRCQYPKAPLWHLYGSAVCYCDKFQQIASATMPNNTYQPPPLTESRVREIVREEIAKAIPAINPKEAP